MNQSLWNTIGVSKVYFSYPVYWTLSVADYFAATNDTATARQLLPFAVDNLVRIAKVINHIPTPGANAYLGWDARLDGTFGRDTFAENQRGMQSLYVQACRSIANVSTV